MDFSKFNAAEQAHLSRVIEKKQVRLPGLSNQTSANNRFFVAARLSTFIFVAGRAVL